MKLILASASPRRAEILRNAGIQFEVRAADVDESRLANETPGDYVCRLALAKALSAAAKYRDGGDQALFLGADTVVVVDTDLLGKPASQDDAQSMLRRLSGRIHEVHTGLALLQMPGTMQRVVEEITRVQFAPITDNEIEDYIATGEPFDKAGAYAIQGIGGRYVTRIEGCYFNVMGLPLARLWSLLGEFGWPNSPEFRSAAN
ncbi:MAG TPA: nucleoside triphosphate pyrophosphatase [Candidatus Acidoferrales bacterium]|nr:nucleoside triphosphate pyrophosphatase [Candidatus Acidoferrales bacterium]